MKQNMDIQMHSSGNELRDSRQTRRVDAAGGDPLQWVEA